MNSEQIEQEVRAITKAAKAASAVMGELDTPTKNAWLLRSAERLEAARDEILAANRRDMEAAKEKGLATPMVNRLGISDGKWADMIQGLHDIRQLQDPVGQVAETRVLENGLQVQRMRIPLGVIGMIYEARPNVTVDAAALCVKAGNACVLRGGSEAFHSNQALGRELRAAARDTGVPEDAIALFPTTDRAAIDVLLKCDREVDLIIPRGGNALVRKVIENSTIPVIAHDLGICHVFLDASAELEMATKIVLESKLRQMPVCNALDTLLVHRDCADSTLPHVLKALHEEGIEIRGCPRTCEVFSEAVSGSEADWGEEFLAPVVAVRVVEDMETAIEHVRRFGSQHTDVIVTSDLANARGWLRRLHSSTVGVNCATGFSDGFTLGLGAEIGVSNTKLHAYGPMGLEGLTTLKFALTGSGQLRG